MTKTAGPGDIAAKKSVLVVDDDEAYREATAKLLRSAGYEVWSAPGYQLALEILETDKPIDALLVDIVMPDGVNGMALARMARLRRPGIAVVYISGYDIPGLEREALGPVVRKPVDDGQLLEATARALQQPS